MNETIQTARRWIVSWWTGVIFFASLTSYGAFAGFGFAPGSSMNLVLAGVFVFGTIACLIKAWELPKNDTLRNMTVNAMIAVAAVAAIGVLITGVLNLGHTTIAKYDEARIAAGDAEHAAYLKKEQGSIDDVRKRVMIGDETDYDLAKLAEQANRDALKVVAAKLADPTDAEAKALKERLVKLQMAELEKKSGGLWIIEHAKKGPGIMERIALIKDPVARWVALIFFSVMLAAPLVLILWAIWGATIGFMKDAPKKDASVWDKAMHLFYKLVVLPGGKFVFAWVGAWGMDYLDLILLPQLPGESEAVEQIQPTLTNTREVTTRAATNVAPANQFATACPRLKGKFEAQGLDWATYRPDHCSGY